MSVLLCTHDKSHRVSSHRMAMHCVIVNLAALHQAETGEIKNKKQTQIQVSSHKLSCSLGDPHENNKVFAKSNLCGTNPNMCRNNEFN